MTLLTVDSSVFVSALNKKDVLHEESREFFEFLKTKDFQIVIPTIVIVEVGNILMKSKKLRNINSFLDKFYEFEVIDLDFEFLTKIFPKFRHFNLKTGDAIIASTASFYNTTLITWDRQLIYQAKKEMDVSTPRQYVSGSR